MARAQTLALPRTESETDGLDETSVRHLVLEYYDAEHLRLRRYLGFLGIVSDISQEIIQESFLKLHLHLLGGGDRSNLRAWLYRVAHNLARNAQTASARNRSDSLSASAPAFELKADSVSAEEDLLARERFGRLRAGIAKLSPAQKECLILRAQGFKYREIADVLNLANSTVAENVVRALERLKEIL